MDTRKGKRTGKSEARKRQGGDIVPVPPRSCANDGLASTSTASGGAELVIAESKDEKRGIKEIKRRAAKDLSENKPSGTAADDLSTDESSEEISERNYALRGMNTKEEKRFYKILEGHAFLIQNDLAEFCYKQIGELAISILEGWSDLDRLESDFVIAANVVYEIVKRRDDKLKMKEVRIREMEELIKKNKETIKKNEVTIKERETTIKIKEEALKKNEEQTERYKAEYHKLLVQKEEHLKICLSLKKDKPQAVEKKDVEAQTQTVEAPDTLEQRSIEEEKDGNGNSRVLERKIEEILQRVKNLEKDNEPSMIEKKKSIDVGEKSPQWSEVIGRRKKKVSPQETQRQDKGRTMEVRRIEEREEGGRGRTEEKTEEITRKKTRSIQSWKKKVPKGAGVLLELRGGSPREYEEAMKKCQKEISLEELGIPPLGVRKARGGGVLIEVEGDASEQKAKQLAGLIKAVIGPREGATVRCPLRRDRLKLTGLPVGVAASEIAEAAAKAGEGRAEAVRVGPLRTVASGVDVAWIECPTRMAVRIAERTVNGLTIGWARVGVSLVERGTSPQCHRCLARGHLMRWCPSDIDRGRCCMRCGEEGHMIGRCEKRGPHCPICEERGLQADHRPGDPSKCVRVPPGVARKDVPPGRRPDSPRPAPREGAGRGDPGEGGTEAAQEGGDASQADTVIMASEEEERGNNEMEEGPGTPPGVVYIDAPGGVPWNTDPSPPSDMEVEEESSKRKRETRESGSDGDPGAHSSPPKDEGGKGKKKR